LSRQNLSLQVQEFTGDLPQIGVVSYNRQMTHSESLIPGIHGVGELAFSRLGINTSRKVYYYSEDGQNLVIKTQSRLIGETVFEDVRAEKSAYETAGRYIPTHPTLFVYGRDEAGRKSLIRIQTRMRARLADLADSELTSPSIRKQLEGLGTGVMNVINRENWVPEVGGLISRISDAWKWPNIRHSTNIMVDEAGSVKAVDINRPILLKRTTNPFGSLVARRVKKRVLDFVRWLREEDTRCLPQVAEQISRRLMPYLLEGISNLPSSGPYIVVYNHDVARGKLTGMPYDSLLVNHILRHTRGISPYTVTNPSSVFSKYKSFHRFGAGLIRGFAARLFSLAVRSVSIENGLKGTQVESELVARLRNGGVISIASARGERVNSVQTGSIWLSFKARNSNYGIPIVPMRFETGANSGYIVRILAPIHCVFSGEILTSDEINCYKTQLHECFFSV